MDNPRINFIQAAVNDVQATIRALDVKVGALLVLVLAPFPNISKVFRHIDKVCHLHHAYLFAVLAVIFFTSWLLALVALVRAIGAIDNPATHIVNSSCYNGAYYGGGLYKFGILDAVISRNSIKANKDVLSFSNNIPITEPDIELELIFEQMKVIYIRDLKATRLKWGVRFAATWLTVGTCIYLISRYGLC
jgi:hypothetical protein